MGNAVVKSFPEGSEWRGWESSGGDTGKANWRKDHRKYRHIRDLAELLHGWQDDVDEWMAQGAGIYEVMAKLRISVATYERWIKEEPEFKEVMDHGLTVSRAWWEHVGRCNLANMRFRENTFKFFMAMRFGVGELAPRPGVPKGSTIHPIANPEAEADSELLDDLYSGGEGNPLPPSTT